MKIVFLLATPYDFKGGCWFYRIQMPYEALMARGHDVKQITIGRRATAEMLDFPDVLFMRGTYGIDPLPLIRDLKKSDTKIVYDVDDDFLTVNLDNPFEKETKEIQEQFIMLCKNADLITCTTDVLKKRLRKFNKNIKVIPNALNLKRFKMKEGENPRLRIGYTGAASHWGDLEIMLDVLGKLQDKYDFDFYLQGMTGTPLVGEIYNYQYIDRENLEPTKRGYYKSALKTYEKLRKIKFVHHPFYPPELYPEVLRSLNFDIGLAPLKDNTFNQAKSCIKFYEYAVTGTPCLASNVLPYKKEVGYCANNNDKDWTNKLEKMIRDKKFRKSLHEKQLKFVKKNNDIRDIVKVWEKTYQEL